MNIPDWLDTNQASVVHRKDGWYWFHVDDENKGTWAGPFPTQKACMDALKDECEIYDEKGEKV